MKTSGGENFTAFLAKKLIPFIDAHYPTTAHRTLIGHSLGGLLVMNTLVHHPGLFENYVAIDPSLNWDQEKLLKQAHEAIAAYTKTLQLKEYPETRQKLAKLQARK